MKTSILFLALILTSISMRAQQNIEGFWNTGKENSIIIINKVNDKYEGTLHSSDNNNAQVGKLLVKDVINSGDTYKGKLFVIDKKEWFNAEFYPKSEKLVITVSNGFGKKTIEWYKIKVKSETLEEIKLSEENAFSEEEIEIANTNLNLEEVAKIFGESSDLEDFEKRLNKSNISNIDLDKDGKVDYLKVVEKNNGDVRTVYVQAPLSKDTYKNVASIVVVKDSNNDVKVKVVGDEAFYGSNYVIIPVYRKIPLVVTWFWGPRYTVWVSPYRVGFYPAYYLPRTVVVAPKTVIRRNSVVRPRPVRRKTVIIKN